MYTNANTVLNITISNNWIRWMIYYEKTIIRCNVIMWKFIIWVSGRTGNRTKTTDRDY